jgi:hypothetical protein
MNVEWTITGVILLGAMAAGGISLYIKKRREANLAALSENTSDTNQNDLS